MMVCLAGCDESVAEDDSPRQFDVTHFSSEVGFAYSQIATTAVCPNGDVWFGYGIGGSGITRFDGSTWETLTEDDGLPQNPVYALACDRDGQLWIGYGINAGGLTRYDGESWTTYTEADGLTSDRIRTIAIGPNGEIWLGFGDQENGVDRLR